MMPPLQNLRSLLLSSAAATLAWSWAVAAEPPRLVFQNGRSLPLSAAVLEGGNFNITADVDGFTVGQVFPFDNVDHIYGNKPPELNPAIALLLMDKPTDALKLLEPILSSQRISAKIPGNFWLEAARATVVAYAVTGNSAKCTELGKEISEATPATGVDPFVTLGKALLLPSSTKAEDRELAFRDLTRDTPADVSAYASIYLANFLNTLKRNPDAALAVQQESEILETYLMVPCLFPSGGMVLNGVAELKASEFLTAMGRREEAVALLKSSAQHSVGTLVAVEANKHLESLK